VGGEAEAGERRIHAGGGREIAEEIECIEGSEKSYEITPDVEGSLGLFISK